MSDPIQELADTFDALYPEDAGVQVVDVRTKPDWSMQPRPENLTRQAQRRLYRQFCKRQGIPPQITRLTDKRERRKARKQALRAQFDKLPRSERNRLRKYTNAQRNAR